MRREQSFRFLLYLAFCFALIIAGVFICHPLVLVMCCVSYLLCFLVLMLVSQRKQAVLYASNEREHDIRLRHVLSYRDIECAMLML